MSRTLKETERETVSEWVWEREGERPCLLWSSVFVALVKRQAVINTPGWTSFTVTGWSVGLLFFSFSCSAWSHRCSGTHSMIIRERLATTAGIRNQQPRLPPPQRERQLQDFTGFLTSLLCSLSILNHLWWSYRVRRFTTLITIRWPIIDFTGFVTYFLNHLWWFFMIHRFTILRIITRLCGYSVHGSVWLRDWD